MCNIIFWSIIAPIVTYGSELCILGPDEVELLRSYDTLYRRHLLGIGQTKIIYYNFPDITGKSEKKLIFVEYVPILIIPACYK